MHRARGAVVVQPSSSAGKAGPVAAWITASGWAAAARSRWGHAWIVTPEGALSPEEARGMASTPELAPSGASSWRRRMPTPLVTLAKDLRQYLHSRSFRLDPDEWTDKDVVLVWQRHEVFQRAGFDLARRLGKPLALFVSAPQVWEARTWGVKRPGWGWLIERFGERPQFRDADLVMCVSDEVARQVSRLGARAGRVLVAPCGADVELFRPEVSGTAVRERHGLEDAVVVGWAGSFRPFHGLRPLLEAAAALEAEVPGLALLFVGDGPERPRVEAEARQLGLRAVFTGTVPYTDMPAHIAAMDVCTVLHAGTETFHYGIPLKLTEYLACGRAVVAPRAGDLDRVLEHERDVLLVAAGAAPLAEAIGRLAKDATLRTRLGHAARARAVADGSWDTQLERAEEALAAVSSRG
jgi:glycosyltransferase involved in cell wall biosynthesis